MTRRKGSCCTLRDRPWGSAWGRDEGLEEGAGKPWEILMSTCKKLEDIGRFCHGEVKELKW